MIRKEAYDALSDEDRVFVEEHAETRTWYVNQTTGTTYLAINLLPGCSAEDLAALNKLGFHVV
jgi:hypothetical protein